MQLHRVQLGFPAINGDSTRLVSEYLTLSRQRTDRTLLEFYAESSLDGDHLIESPRSRTLAEAGTLLGRVMWLVVLPVVGLYCVHRLVVLLPSW